MLNVRHAISIYWKINDVETMLYWWVVNRTAWNYAQRNDSESWIFAMRSEICQGGRYAVIHLNHPHALVVTRIGFFIVSRDVDISRIPFHSPHRVKGFFFLAFGPISRHIQYRLPFISYSVLLLDTIYLIQPAIYMHACECVCMYVPRNIIVVRMVLDFFRPLSVIYSSSLLLYSSL